ncbi:MAG: bacillithiol system protein YtxJ [Salibacteraceae bacterium]|jgi:bacillithiol system protein YtxJ
MNWRKLTSVSEFEDLMMQSSIDGSAFILFKHSTRCMVSTMALRSFESEFRSDIPTYMVDLIQDRDLSNFIAKTTQVEHQSPQVISIKAGVSVYNESHYQISAELASEL